MATDIELYRLMIETVTANENRRHQISAVYLALAAAGLGLISTQSSVNYNIIATGSLFLSIIWLLQIKYLKNLASAKFRVILELEKKFTFQPFATEWEHMKSIPSIKLFQLSILEMLIPMSISVASIIYFAYPFSIYLCKSV